MDQDVGGDHPYNYIVGNGFNILKFMLKHKTSILKCACISVLIRYILKEIKKNYYLPPGPWGLPIVGRLPWMNRTTQHTYMVNLAKDYGDVCSVKLGSKTAVCLANPHMIRKLFLGSDYLYRPDTPLNRILEGYGLVLSEGRLWNDQRNFVIEKLRCMASANNQESRTEAIILMEVEDLMSSLDRRQTELIDPLQLFGLYVHNVICQITMSFRFQENSPQYRTYNRLVSEGMQLYGEVHLIEYLPIFALLPRKRAVLDAIRRNLQEISEFHLEQVLARQEARREHQHVQPAADLLDSYLDKFRSLDGGQDMRDIFCGVDRVKQLVQVMNDLFSAGMETVRSGLGWLVVTMLHWPHVAERVRSELAAVTGGPGATVTLAHRNRLPYTEATIMEMLRRVHVVPLGTTHSNEKETTLKGYKIPPGSLVIPLLSKAHMNPEYFSEPHDFRPERFLKNGAVYWPEYFIPFGHGRRGCLGDFLAKEELFLFFANIMNNYDFRLPRGIPLPDLEGPCGATHAPKPFTVRFVRRRINVRNA